jgi:hypothetical protein
MIALINDKNYGLLVVNKPDKLEVYVKDNSVAAAKAKIRQILLARQQGKATGQVHQIPLEQTPPEDPVITAINKVATSEEHKQKLFRLYAEVVKKRNENTSEECILIIIHLQDLTL